MRILFLGDIMGRPGREAVKTNAKKLRDELELDAIVANAENTSGGIGLTLHNARELLGAGIDVLTGGNHIWRYRDLVDELDNEPRILRPANYPPGAPGRGMGVFQSRTGKSFAVVNLMGRLFMDLDPPDCPFRAMDALLSDIPSRVTVRFVDFHAEATSEKVALAHYLDGRVSAVAGTHTHVQTNDARILSGGTAAITDAGMCGVEDSVIGMGKDAVLRRFVTGLPQRFAVAEGPAVLHGALFDIDEATGKAVAASTFRRAPDESAQGVCA